ncbi:hypothetical protein FZZ93_15215 [Halomonas eurihalina]|uniref:Sulfotransferase n=1 Tax=Halomonas eurihalina TaxID=42566 RepID=A0A5D9CTR9_HALER|nr:hypothetical protein [Halomonas eurihalina]MDR5860829.1 hypothetical protein [Halomonas eurihalina]TZG33801.1 hypothetical protein FZZ93_15215 [Halomonas eurihalina]
MEICIIGGFPRAGTRQFTDILNNHDNASIKGEFYPKVISSLLNVFQIADKINAGRWTGDNYRKWRMMSALNAYAAFSKGSNSPFDFQGLKVAGFKCPRAENNFLEIKEVIGFERVVFFYCVRNVKESFLSENSSFGVSVEDYVSKTTESMRSGLAVSENENVDFQVLSLDEFLCAHDKTSWVIDNMLSKFRELSFDEHDVRNILGKVENTNATERHGKKRRTRMTREECEFFNESSEFLRLAKLFEDKYKIKVL